ncbi:MAG: RES family NAD+ phosphorylase [Bryobacteraceae bacterium]
MTTAPTVPVSFRSTLRLVPSRYPSTGILDRIAAPEDLEAIIELESWTNDRIGTELGLLHRLPKGEWVVGKRMSSVIMAAFSQPRITGARFSSGERGAWYAARTVETAHAEVVFHRTRELEEIGVLETFVQVRAYLADFAAEFHDIRGPNPEFKPLYSPSSYTASQRFGQDLLAAGSNGVVYHSVRRKGGECLACFRPKQVKNVRQGDHFEYRWHGTRMPTIRKLS